MKTAIIVLADDKSYEGLGRVVNAMVATKETLESSSSTAAPPSGPATSPRTTTVPTTCGTPCTKPSTVPSATAPTHSSPT